MSAFFAGLSLGFSLIIVIGAQNAFVLRQGLRGQYVLAVCLICALSDGILIALGVSGFALAMAEFPQIERVARYAGAAFLLLYGARSLWSALRSSAYLQAADEVGDSAVRVISTCLMVTWLNPHAYLDTMILLGSISTHYPDGKIQFTGGATLSSFAVFFAIGYGAQKLQRFFREPKSWRILDAAIGVLMWGIAIGLLLS